MATKLLNSGNLKDYQAIGEDGILVWQRADAFRTSIINSPILGRKYADILALPKFSSDATHVDWFIPFDSDRSDGEYEVVSWNAATLDEKNRAYSYLNDLKSKFLYYGMNLEASALSSNDKLFAHFLIGNRIIAGGTDVQHLAVAAVEHHILGIVIAEPHGLTGSNKEPLAGADDLGVILRISGLFRGNNLTTALTGFHKGQFNGNRAGNTLATQVCAVELQIILRIVGTDVNSHHCTLGNGERGRNGVILIIERLRTTAAVNVEPPAEFIIGQVNCKSTAASGKPCVLHAIVKIFLGDDSSIGENDFTLGQNGGRIRLTGRKCHHGHNSQNNGKTDKHSD